MTREAVLEIEDALKASNEERPLIPSAHHFAKSPIEGYWFYVRETFLPANVIVVGAIHKYETINTITMGAVKAYNPEQPELGKLMVAPYNFTSPEGSKRVVAAYADSIWQTVHLVESCDPDKVKEELIVLDYSELTLDERRVIGDLQA